MQRILSCLFICLALCSASQAWIYHPVAFETTRFDSAYLYPSNHETYPNRIWETDSAGSAFYTLDLHAEGSWEIPELVDSPVFGGSGKALKLSVPSSTEAKDRCEYQHHYGIPFGYDSYTAFALYVPAGTPNPKSWHILYQWWQVSPNTPPMSINFLENGNYALILRNDDDAYQQIYSEPLPRDQWVRFFIHHRFGLGGTGQTRLWVDGALKTNFTGTIGWEGGDTDVNGKFGIYRAGENVPCTIYYDEVRVGTNFSQVWLEDPGGPATIVGWSSFSSNVMEMRVDAPGAPERYNPSASTNLVAGSWTNVAHSTNGFPGTFVETNLAYSATDATGTNEVIYVKADVDAEFFRINGE